MQEEEEELEGSEQQDEEYSDYNEILVDPTKAPSALISS